MTDVLIPQATVSPVVWLACWLLALLGLNLNYFLITLSSYAYFWRLPTNAIRIQERDIRPGQIRREISWSMLSMVVYATLTVATIFAFRKGWFPNLYVAPLERGWLTLIGGFLFILVVQDVLFYVTHRLLHTRLLARFHRVHHASKLPTPFALYSFHPVEALLHFVRIPLILIVCPTNLFVFIFCEVVISNGLNAYSHLNYEPRWVRNIRWLHERCAAASSYHGLHHEKSQGNYGGYLRLWDRLAGTMLPESKSSDRKVYGS
jgi:sterol desaturase/sphingolipid hydroxylase (fatty acid hydroxylase superfamily)